MVRITTSKDEGRTAPAPQGPSWGYLKSPFLAGLSTFGDNFPQKRPKGSKNVHRIPPRRGFCGTRASSRSPLTTHRYRGTSLIRNNPCLGPYSRHSTFLSLAATHSPAQGNLRQVLCHCHHLRHMGISLIRNHHPAGPYSRTMPRLLWWS